MAAVLIQNLGNGGTGFGGGVSGTQGAYASGSGRRMPCPRVVT